jgi:hypothetical protein
VFGNQMTDPDALSPFPNSLVWNWATIFVMAFGNLGALDLEARCLAGKGPTIAVQVSSPRERTRPNPSLNLFTLFDRFNLSKDP